MLKASNLSHQYSGGNRLKFPDLSIGSGEEWLILGQSGCGKTTLLNLLSGLLKPESGSVELAGTNLSKLSGARLDKFRGKHIGVVFQQSHFIASLTVLQNLLLAQKLAGVKRDRVYLKRLLEKLGLSDKVNRLPSRLSVGEQQRVSIARALATKPKLILADEPTSALDDKNCEVVLNLLREASSETGAALVIVTHDTRLKLMVGNNIEL